MRAKHVWIASMLNLAGFLLSAPGFFLLVRLGIDDWTVPLILNVRANPSVPSVAVYYYLIVLFLFCLIAGWGVMQQRRWSPAASIAASPPASDCFPSFPGSPPPAPSKQPR
jgi:hypothetical protein